MDPSKVDIYSFANEKEIARSFSKRFQWEMVLIGLGQAFVFLSLWPLVILNIIPLWIAAPISCLCKGIDVYLAGIHNHVPLNLAVRPRIRPNKKKR